MCVAGFAVVHGCIGGKSAGDKLYQYSQVDTRGRLSKDKKRLGLAWRSALSRKAMEEGAQRQGACRQGELVKTAMEEGGSMAMICRQCQATCRKGYEKGRSMAMSLLKMPSRMQKMAWKKE